MDLWKLNPEHRILFQSCCKYLGIILPTNVAKLSQPRRIKRREKPKWIRYLTNWAPGWDILILILKRGALCFTWGRNHSLCWNTKDLCMHKALFLLHANANAGKVCCEVDTSLPYFSQNDALWSTYIWNFCLKPVSPSFSFSLL